MMAKARVEFRGELATVTLHKDVLEEFGVRDGDELTVAVTEDAIILHSADNAARAELIQQATDKVFEKYDGVLAELAEGMSTKSREERVKEIAEDLIERRADVYRALSDDVD